MSLRALGPGDVVRIRSDDGWRYWVVGNVEPEHATLFDRQGWNEPLRLRAEDYARLARRGDLEVKPAKRLTPT